mgnify:CR=1 FL=1
MNIDTATNTLRALAKVAGVPNAESITIALTPYKGVGSKSYNKGFVVASAVGWRVNTYDSEVFARDERDAASAIERLVDGARNRAESIVREAEHRADRLRCEATSAEVVAQGRRAAFTAIP